MWFRGALAALLLGACYSPSIANCELACAGGDTCPNGFACTNGFCARTGTASCGGDDAAIDVPGDTPGTTCGDQIVTPGEICYQPAYTIPTGVIGISDAQFVRFDADTAPDLVYLGTSGFVARINQGNVFSSTTAAGPMTQSNRFRAMNLDAGGMPELVSNDATTGEVRLWRYSGSMWMLESSASGPMASAIAFASVGLTHQGEPDELTVAWGNRVSVYTVTGGNNLMLAQVGPNLGPGVFRDLALGDFDNDAFGEIAVATTQAVVVYNFDGTNYSEMPNAISATTVTALGAGDADGDGDEDLYYGMSGADGQVGVLRWNGTAWESTAQLTVPRLLGPIEVRDLDGDHRSELIAATDANNSVRILIWPATGDGKLASTPLAFPVPEIQGLTQIRVNADFSGDGVPDIAITSTAAGKISILQSNP